MSKLRYFLKSFLKLEVETWREIREIQILFAGFQPFPVDLLGTFNDMPLLTF